MSGDRDEKKYEETGSYETGAKEEEAARLRVTLASVLAVLPPSPASLPGCSPSFYRSTAPRRLPEATVMDGDRILIENENKVHRIGNPQQSELYSLSSSFFVNKIFFLLWKLNHDLCGRVFKMFHSFCKSWKKVYVFISTRVLEKQKPKIVRFLSF